MSETYISQLNTSPFLEPEAATALKHGEFISSLQL